MDISRLKKVCRSYSDCADEYYVESIPENKAHNARSNLYIPTSEIIVALIDLTIFGSAENAFVVTENGLYWRTISEDPQNLTWDQLKHRTICETKTFMSKAIDFGNGVKMDLNGANELVKKDNHSVLQLLNNLKRISEDIKTDKQPTDNSNDLHNGLVECEFCKSKIKPEVTYCKYCGIKLRG